MNLSQNAKIAMAVGGYGAGYFVLKSPLVNLGIPKQVVPLLFGVGGVGVATLGFGSYPSSYTVPGGIALGQVVLIGTFKAIGSRQPVDHWLQYLGISVQKRAPVESTISKK